MELDHWDNLLLLKIPLPGQLLDQLLDQLLLDPHLDLHPDLPPDLPLDPLPGLLQLHKLPVRSYALSTPFLKKEKNPKDANFPSVLKAKPISIVQLITPKTKLNGVLQM